METMLEHEPNHARHESDDDRSRTETVELTYRKPTLTHLGQWNLFTRVASAENEDNGFFEFDVG